MNTNIENFPIGTYKDWRFGLVTREVYRVNQNLFELNDTSDGWLTAMVDLKTFIKLMDGTMPLTSLDWE